MAEPLACPRCAAILTDTEVITLHRRYASAQRKTKAGGRKGGRRKAISPDAALNECPTSWEPEPALIPEKPVCLTLRRPVEDFRSSQGRAFVKADEWREVDSDGDVWPIDFDADGPLLRSLGISRETVLVPLEDEL